MADEAPREPPAAPRRAPSGWFAIEADLTVRGWCRDRSRPDQRLDVTVLVDGDARAVVRADRLIPRLAASGEGDGRFGFAFALPPALFDGADHEVRVEAAGEGDVPVALKTRRATFAAPAGTPAPAAAIGRVGPAGLEGVLTGPPGLREELDVWLDGRRLAPHEVVAEWSWGERQALPFRLQVAELSPFALIGRDLRVGYPGTLPDADAPPLAALVAATVQPLGGGAYQVVLGPGLAFPPGSTLRAEVREEGGEAPLALRRLPLDDGRAVLELDEAALRDRMLLRLATAGGERIGPDLPFARADVPRRLLPNGDLARWTAHGPDGLAVATDVPGERGFHVFPPTLKAQFGLTGNLLAARIGPGPGLRPVLSAVASGLGGGRAAKLGLGLFARASRPVHVALRLLDGGEERAVLALSLGTRWRAEHRAVDLPPVPLADPRIELAVSPGEDGGPLLLEVAGLHAGDPALVTFGDPVAPAPFAAVPGANLAVNADLVRWPAGLAFGERAARFELAEGWALDNPAGGEVRVAAFPAPGDAPGRYALALEVADAGEPVRVEVLLAAALPAVAGEVSFDARLGDAAAGRWGLIDRIRILRREAGTAGGTAEKVVASVARRVVLTRRWERSRFAFAVDGAGEAGFDPASAAGDAEWLLQLEVRRPTALALANLEVRVGAPPAEPRPLPVAFEDQDVATQVDALRGLEGWREARVLRPAVRPDLPGPGAPARWAWPAAPTGTVEVAVCVRDAPDETLGCLCALAAAGGPPHTVRIVDDLSSEDTRQRILHFVADRPWMTFDPNPRHLGYTASADRAVRAAAADWVVLLNSDTVPAPGWLDGLLEAAADPRTALVGPVSNAATYQSVPEPYDGTGRWAVNPLPPGFAPADMAALVRDAAPRVFAEVPLLNGFCLAVRRQAFVEVGGLDARAFPAGYGEENDLCIRLARAGWRLRLADHVYVHHLKSRSFGHARRAELTRAGDQALRALHPEVDFAALGRAYLALPALAAVRAAVRAAYPRPAPADADAGGDG